MKRHVQILLTLVVSTQSTLGMQWFRNYFFPEFAQSRHEFMMKAQQRANERKARLQEMGIPDYTVNMQWINAKLNPSQSYIHPSANALTLRKNLLFGLYSWARKNPDAEGVVLWYDSQLTPKDAVENTRKIIAKDRALMGLFKQKTAPIILKDVRELPEVKKNPIAFSEGSPIFFRVDILRAIEAYNNIKGPKTEPNPKDKPIVSMHADTDVATMNPKEIFDTNTMRDLRQYGMLLADPRVSDDANYFGVSYENSFKLLSNYNTNLLKALNYVLIKPSIKSATTALPLRYDPKLNNMYHALHELIFRNYKDMFNYFYGLEGLGKLTYKGEDYSKEKHGTEPFLVSPKDDAFYNQRFHESIKLKPYDAIPKLRIEEYKGEPFIPTKRVKVPPSNVEWFKQIRKDIDEMNRRKKKAKHENTSD